MIYADNAATTKMCDAAADMMEQYNTIMYGNPSSIHSAGRTAAKEVCNARYEIAECLNCDPYEIVFTSGGSEADNQAILSVALGYGFAHGKKHIVSTNIEHHAVLHTLDFLKGIGFGFEITLVPVRENGIADANDVAAAIREDTCLVTIMYANNEIGTLQPIEKISEICREKGVMFHTDAVQAIGHVPIDVEKLGVDMLSLSGHKFHGPKGVGALYCRKALMDDILFPLIHGGEQERGKRAGTENVSGIVGMSAALNESCANLEKEQAEIKRMCDRLIEGLSEIPHAFLNGDREQRLPGTVNFSFDGIEGESLLLMLDDAGICASAGSACTAGSLDPSHVLTAIGRDESTARGSIRFSLGRYNKMEEAETIIAETKKAVAKLRESSMAYQEKYNSGH
jgi:cysteine desulfurase